MSEPRLTERPILTHARIGVLMGGQSAERDISLRTGVAVHRSLVRRGYNAVAIDVGPTLFQNLPASFRETESAERGGGDPWRAAAAALASGGGGPGDLTSRLRASAAR